MHVMNRRSIQIGNETSMLPMTTLRDKEVKQHLAVQNIGVMFPILLQHPVYVRFLRDVVYLHHRCVDRHDLDGDVVWPVEWLAIVVHVS